MLTRLALRSKAHWGYDGAFMEACRTELTLTPAMIAGPGLHVTVARADGVLAGYCALSSNGGETLEVEALFVDPPHIGRGIGRLLLHHARRRARTLGATTLIVQSDPDAAGFYAREGGRRIGSQASHSLPRRLLPLFEFVLENQG